MQVTFCPEGVHDQPLLVNGTAGGVIPAGFGIVVVIGPVAGAFPIFATVTGIFEVCPAVNGGIGPVVVTKSGAVITAGVTGDVGEAGFEVLLLVTVSPVTGFVIAINCGVVFATAFVGVTGTLKVLFVP